MAPYVQWFWAAYLVTSHTAGLSALQLQRQLGIARYETAWVMLHGLLQRPQLLTLAVVSVSQPSM